MMKFWGVSLIALISTVSVAEPINHARAKFNYQMLCMGCHTMAGVGNGHVPKMKGFIGNFLKFQEGREYLVRVPGSANSTLNDARLAEVLNWMILNYAESSLPEKMQHYTADEVSSLRSRPFFEVTQYRKKLLKKIDAIDHP